jgi:hypothetical protein
VKFYDPDPEYTGTPSEDEDVFDTDGFMQAVDADSLTLEQFVAEYGYAPDELRARSNEELSDADWSVLDEAAAAPRLPAATQLEIERAVRTRPPSRTRLTAGTRPKELNA